MKFIKVGSAYLNMDLVTDAWVSQGQVTLFFAVPAMYSPVPFRGESNAITTREIRFSGEQAAAVVRWLEKRAKDITPHVEQAADEVTPADTTDLDLTEYSTVDDGPSFPS